MSKNPAFASTGSEAGTIDVRLSYRIVRLFSEGLYASPNKAIEELVANSSTLERGESLFSCHPTFTNRQRPLLSLMTEKAWTPMA